ncbi:hypothetical protein K3495_g1128 [Podosphaera aphanis]|nr:hypothetical protein K3495_g1128 [Podosphaera aphanis]
MSWQAYVDDSLVKSGNVDKGAIYSKEGDSKWAASSGFEVSTEELKKIIGGLAGGETLQALYDDGIFVTGEKYVLTRAEDRSLYARKGREGVVIVKTLKAILIAHYNEIMIAGNCSSTVESLADYLIKSGY